MATKRSSTPKAHQRLLLFIIITTLSTPSSSASNFAENNDQVRLLLSFKSLLTDPFNVLSSWTNATGFCQWHGVACDNSSRVVAVVLAARNISGAIFPPIFKLPGLETLDLSNNQLFGELPGGIVYSNSLRYLNLSNNNLTGPVRLGSVPSLETLDLSNNMLSGTIPGNIGEFSSLKFLDLGGNVLSGTVPVSVSNISGLEYLTLASNQLSGEIPRELWLVKSLKLVYLGYNNFSGRIPRDIGGLRNLQHLDLVYNNLSGPIPSIIGNLTELRYLFLYQNKFSGSVPETIFELQNLVSLDLSDNFLSGEISSDIGRLQQLEILHLFSNSFAGEIPAGLANLPRLRVLQLWSNNFSGEIPEDLGKRNNLTILDLSTNRLVGEIPAGLCDSGKLFKLILFSNSLGGTILESLSQCKSLTRVRLQDNRFSGEIPAEFTKLPLIYFLDISGNNFSGQVGDSEWEMASLQMLNFGRNLFSGKLPDSFGSDRLENLIASENRFSGEIPSYLFRNSTKLMQLDLSHNELSGPIPEELSLTERLVSLDLSHNKLDGQIPASLALMPVLGRLDLSDNELSGEIPRNLGQVPSLVEVNISRNRLHGSLPTTAAFLAINATAVAGNIGLCDGGVHSSSGLQHCTYMNRTVGNKNRRHTLWLVLAAALVAATAAAAFSAAVYLRRRMRSGFDAKRVESNQDGESWELRFFDSKLSKSVTIEDIVLSAKQGKGRLSLSGSSEVFLVKEIAPDSSSVWSETGEFGKIRHRNVVRLMGLCRSEKGCYLVYECVEGGKVLGEVLRGLSWESRRKIAVGVARALRFLHCECSSMVVVIGRLSPEEILVDVHGEPRLRLRAPGMLYFESKGFSSSAYAAPEASKGTISEKSDIYGFGLILIELLTGKSPTDAEFGIHETFLEWARFCYSDCHLDTWADPSIREHVSRNRSDIVETMNLALHCTAEDPKARPCAGELCKTLTSVIMTKRSCVTYL